MFSALKRLTKKQDDQKASIFPSGIAAIGEAMQKKFAKGVNYNMKIVIRGDRNTGKSCLLQRLQGKPFNPAYIPTQEIQAASINWNHKGGEDVVKVDVWDIVDKGEKKKQNQGLKIFDNMSEDAKLHDGMTLDADAIDVYKDTHGVIMLLDITKIWTWSYIERLLPNVPYHIPVLVLANFRDIGEHRVVDVERMRSFIEHLDRPAGSAEVNFAESSMKDGFGLRYLYKFLSIPFLILQRETLLRQLEANALRIESVREELLYGAETEDQDYSKFMETIESKKAKTPDSISPCSEINETESSPNISNNRMTNVTNATQNQIISQLPPANLRQSSIESSHVTGKERHYTARIEQKIVGSTGRLDEFSPEDELDPTFLSEEKQKRWWQKTGNKKQQLDKNTTNDSDEESDSDGGNPLVADFQDLTSDEEQQSTKVNKVEGTKSITKAKESEGDSSDEDGSNDVGPNIFTEQHHHIHDVANDDSSLDLPKQLALNDKRSKTTETEEKVTPKESSETFSDEDDEPSNDESEPRNQYEVAEDFDLEEPELNNWLDDVDDSVESKASHNISQKATTAGESTSHDFTKEKTHSFSIGCEELDIFVNEQLRKVSISEVEKDNEVKKVKKKKEKKQGAEGERKKKKKTVKEKGDVDVDEKQQKKKRSKGTMNKKKKSSKKDSEPADYELL